MASSVLVRLISHHGLPEAVLLDHGGESGRLHRASFRSVALHLPVLVFIFVSANLFLATSTSMPMFLQPT
jgi:hypothetical protein